MRYFLITFNLKDIASIGNIVLEHPTFPSHSFISRQIAEQYLYNYEIVIINIFEFKNEEDYNNFIQ